MNQEQTNITTGKQIRHLRTQLGMTQEELAGELNVTRHFYTSITSLSHISKETPLVATVLPTGFYCTPHRRIKLHDIIGSVHRSDHVNHRAPCISVVMCTTKVPCATAKLGAPLDHFRQEK